jgi:hypothetical protein
VCRIEAQCIGCRPDRPAQYTCRIVLSAASLFHPRGKRHNARLGSPLNARGNPTVRISEWRIERPRSFPFTRFTQCVASSFGAPSTHALLLRHTHAHVQLSLWLCDARVAESLMFYLRHVVTELDSPPDHFVDQLASETHERIWICRCEDSWK